MSLRGRRLNKRLRTLAEGGSYHNFVPLGTDDLLDVHSREGRLLKVGKGFTAPPLRTVQKSDEQWGAATTWAPLDDPLFALDSDEAWYDEALDAPVMEDVDPPVTHQRRAKSKVSVSFLGTLHQIFPHACIQRRPHVVWKELHRSTYLDELIRTAGRGDFRQARNCADCAARSVDNAGPPIYRCEECFIPDLTCMLCCVRRHRRLPFHKIEVGVSGAMA